MTDRVLGANLDHGDVIELKDGGSEVVIGRMYAGDSWHNLRFRLAHRRDHPACLVLVDRQDYYVRTKKADR